MKVEYRRNSHGVQEVVVKSDDQRVLFIWTDNCFDSAYGGTDFRAEASKGALVLHETSAGYRWVDYSVIPSAAELDLAWEAQNPRLDCHESDLLAYTIEIIDHDLPSPKNTIPAPFIGDAE
jgi:hypothetical protein